jgi:hypothetical protein
MRASPLARRPIASKKAVPQNGFRSESQAALVNLVRRFGLPSQLAASRDGSARWSASDLEGLPLDGIRLSDTENGAKAIQMRAEAKKPLAFPGAVVELGALWQAQVQLHTNGTAVRVVGSTRVGDHTCLAALALACACAEALFTVDQVRDWNLLEEWSNASLSHTGYRRTMLLLGYALSDEEQKTYRGFEQFQADFDLNVEQ